MTATTLDGYQPAPGDIVWQQMYNPQTPTPDSTITERVAAGATYGRPRLMIVREIHAHDDGRRTRWVLQVTDPNRRRGGTHGYSWVEDDWCVLELVRSADQGRMS